MADVAALEAEVKEFKLQVCKATIYLSKPVSMHGHID